MTECPLYDSWDDCQRRRFGQIRTVPCSPCPLHPFAETLARLTLLHDQGQEEESS